MYYDAYDTNESEEATAELLSALEAELGMSDKADAKIHREMAPIQICDKITPRTKGLACGAIHQRRCP